MKSMQLGTGKLALLHSLLSNCAADDGVRLADPDCAGYTWSALK